YWDYKGGGKGSSHGWGGGGNNNSSQEETVVKREEEEIIIGGSATFELSIPLPIKYLNITVGPGFQLVGHSRGLDLYFFLQTPTIELGIFPWTWVDFAGATGRADRRGWSVQEGAIGVGTSWSLDVKGELYLIPAAAYSWRLWSKRW
ncbi:hypothetical protein KAW48_02440, partial [candidate division WOR-3 bacterium]|nr:hypothetical protein [candidate division WOR-3 bacterium]